MAHKIDVSKGEARGEVSAQWASRSPDERFTSLGELHTQVSTWAAESRVEAFKPKDITFTADGSTGLGINLGDHLLDLTNYSFGQVAALAGAPRKYLSTLPAPLAAANLRYGLLSADQDEQAAYVRENGKVSLRGITSPRYGRILDKDVVEAVQKIAGDGTGDAPWKVPGCIDWMAQGGPTYNAEVDITKENTTLYASDRDLFLFLVDDKNPIAVGKLDSGEDDLMFRGFYVWNSEVGCRTFGVATMYLRGVCQNRNLWGVEGFSETVFKHTSGAPDRFLSSAAPALESYAKGSASKVVEGVKAAKAAIVSPTDDDRMEFLVKLGFTPKAARGLIVTGEKEEGHAPKSIWDHAQAITAQARKSTYQEDRLQLEGVAGKLLDKVNA